MHRQAVTAYIALGANLGMAADTLRWAVVQISVRPMINLLTQSSLYCSTPIDSSGPDYINAVMSVSTELNPYALLSLLQNIEQTAGRDRPYRNAPRTLDLDLVLYGSAYVESERLTVPHPRMRDRAFVLVPLHEIAPDLVSTADLERVANQRIVRI